MLKKYILIVEDDISLRNIMTEVFKSEGHEVLAARNGQHAFEVIAKEGAPALIFLDIIMPIMDGREFLKLFREDAKNSHIPVVVMSATARESEINGANHFIQKPAGVEIVLKYANQYLA